MIEDKHFKTLIVCAKRYKLELLNTNVIFIYQNRYSKKYFYIESSYYASNFQHLSGVLYENDEHEIIENQAADFLTLATNGRLVQRKCHYKKGGTTKIKLDILPTVIDIKKVAKMIGDYINSRVYISVADKVAGNTRVSLAFVNANKNMFPVLS